MSIATEVERISQAKKDLKAAIESKGVSVGSDELINTYHERVLEISQNSEVSGNIEITENGTYNVAAVETATVNVEPETSPYPIIEGDGEIEVRFIDYEGTLLKVQYVNGGESATAPELPEHDRLTFVEWNRDFDNITHDLDVGAVYTPTSGNTELFISVTEETGLDVTLSIGKTTVSDSIAVNWGDETSQTVVANGAGAKIVSHSYSSYGDYMISIISKNPGSYYLNALSTMNLLIGSNEENSFKLLKKCYCSDSVSSIGEYCFYKSVNLEEITTSAVTRVISTFAFVKNKIKAIVNPRTATGLGWYSISGCNDLEFVVLNDEMTSLSFPFFIGSKMERLILPEGYTATSYSNLTGYCSSLETVWYAKPAADYILSKTVCGAGSIKKIPIYDNLTSIENDCFSQSSIESVKIPPSLTQIKGYSFAYAPNLKDIYIYTDTVPTLGSSLAFNAASKFLKIHVKPEMLSAFQEATNWSSSKNKLVGDLEGEFEDGYC